MKATERKRYEGCEPWRTVIVRAEDNVLRKYLSKTYEVGGKGSEPRRFVGGIISPGHTYADSFYV